MEDWGKCFLVHGLVLYEYIRVRLHCPRVGTLVACSSIADTVMTRQLNTSYTCAMMDLFCLVLFDRWRRYMPPPTIDRMYQDVHAGETNSSNQSRARDVSSSVSDVCLGFHLCEGGGRGVRGVCLGAQAAQVFSPVGSRAQTPLCHPASTGSYTIIIIAHHHFLTPPPPAALRPYIYTPHPLPQTPTVSRSFDYSPIPPDCISLQKPYPPGAGTRFAAKTNSLQHHQKVRSYLRPAIDRNPRRPSTDPQPRGNDTALVRTRRSSKIAIQQASASRSQSRGHSSASE